MPTFLILISLIILCCVLLNNASFRIGVPVLLAFILLGIAVGNIDAIAIALEDFSAGERICSTALIFIMFYGGFGTRWETAKPVAVQAGILATLGVAITAGITGLFCHFVLKWGWIESFLMGSVISSTDAASVFSILRSRNLGLKNNAAPLLEMESGSNDPMSYMLTILMLSLMNGTATGAGIGLMLVKQIVLGAGLGILIAKGTVFCMRKIDFATSGFDSLFIFAVAIFSYALPSLIGGNGYLSAYLVGIILGNEDFGGKKKLVGFFDAMTGLMQVVIFFVLGLLARPADLISVALPALAIFACLLLLSRPISIVSILPFFKKFTLKQQGFISFVGLRGAASIVFAITAMLDNDMLEHDIFSIVFVIVLISIAIQGSLIPTVAKKLDMIDPDADVMKTFSDFGDESDLQFFSIKVTDGNVWLDRKIMELGLSHDSLICMIIRDNGRRVLPTGQTVIRNGDEVIFCSKEFDKKDKVRIVEHRVRQGSQWDGRPIKDYPNVANDQVLLIRRGKGTIIPHGGTILKSGDLLYINKGQMQ